MTLVRIVKDWNYPANFFRQTPGFSKRWKDVEFTEEPVSSCDYLIVLQRPPYDINVKCLKGNTWIVSQEPPVSYFNFYKKSFQYFDKVFTYYRNIGHSNQRSMQPMLPWHVHKSYDELLAISKDKIGKKKDTLSWITSNKNAWPGHKARMKLKNHLLQSTIPFHLMGTGFQFIEDKFDGLYPYKYTLSIENYSTDNYWTEKLSDAFLSWCLPFYWGDPEIFSYFPQGSMILIDPNKPAEALKIIQTAIDNNEWEKRLDAIEEARNLVLNKYQFFPFVQYLIEKERKTNTDRQYVNYKIPKNPYPWQFKLMNSAKYYIKRIFLG